MSPSNALRSFAITLAIAIAVIAQEASGFTLNRNNYTPTTEQHTDLVADESSVLQVKDDLKILNNIQHTTHGDSDKPPVGSDTNDTETGLEIIKESNDVTSTKQPLLAQTTARTESATEDPKIPTISSDTVEVYGSAEDEKFIETEETNSTETSALNSEFDLNETVISLENTDPEKVSEVESSTVQDQTGTTADEMTLKNSSEISEATTNTTEAAYMNTAENNDLSQTIPASSFLSTIQYDESSPPTEVPLVSTFSEADVTQIATGTDANFTEPWWDKYTKYTTIVRERVNSAESTTENMKAEEDAMKVETSNTQLNFEKIIDATSISPFQKKRIDLQTSTNRPSANGETIQETEKSTAAMQATEPTIYNVITIGAKRKETVQAKRAGYLDNSEKSTTPMDNFFLNMEKEESVTFGTVDENDAETESLDFKNKNVTSLESQRQLAEDAIQEELLKEETLNDHNDNANRYRDERPKDEEGKGEDKPGAAVDAEDLLQVRPIGGAPLTPGPAYRPMKRIDVQPTRPVHRDPDDNSWRNESISSLGIVFKPKVATKSFKEVLKKKTQTELNNLPEKDTKDQVPDLRVRLEKIAEVRKTKKKKMNKDGEQVYSDYEEGNSAEAGGSPKPDEGLAPLSSAEMSKLLTPFNYPAALEPTTPTTADLEANKTRVLPVPDRDSPPAGRPKKKFNLAEYYDSTDEYDADYVTLPNIDLKKFPRPPKTTRPPPPPFPRSEPPERRPTVQYFPPRPPLKVNVDNFDPDFERKVNLFTFKPATEAEPRPQFVTVPAVVVVSQRAPPPPPAVLSASYYGPGATRGPAAPSRGPDGAFGRGSYVIKHYKDFLHAAAQESEDDRRAVGPPPPRALEGDPDSRLRKEALNRFVADFNRQSERFKVDFPVLMEGATRRVAGEGAASPAPARCARCDVTVELSPAYELHYYVPGQEEREEPPGGPAV